MPERPPFLIENVQGEVFRLLYGKLGGRRRKATVVGNQRAISDRPQPFVSRDGEVRRDRDPAAVLRDVEALDQRVGPRPYGADDGATFDQPAVREVHAVFENFAGARASEDVDSS